MKDCRVAVTCVHCGLYFRVPTYRLITAKFCSLQCKYVHPLTKEVREKISVSTKKKMSSREMFLKMSEKRKGKTSWMKGKNHTEEAKFKNSIKHIGMNAGPKHWQWKGGITPINLQIRNSAEYINWRKAIFERDDYTCQECKIRGGKLNADHIKPFALHPELRFELSNGRTLCVDCHRKTDTWGTKSWKSRTVSNVLVHSD